MRKSSSPPKQLIPVVLILLTSISVIAQTPAAKQSRLFILSGQSNMANLDPATVFNPTVTKAFPDDDVIVIKDAVPGKPIERWLKESKKAKSGDLYDQLMRKLLPAIEGKHIKTVVLVWMQGETDGQNNLGSVYPDKLHALIKQFRDTLKRPDMAVVLGRISDHFLGQPSWDSVRKAQESAPAIDPLINWVDTDDLNGPGNGMHYNKEGYRMLGERFAAKAIEMTKKIEAKK
jgi:hypothetical protein